MKKMMMIMVAAIVMIMSAAVVSAATEYDYLTYFRENMNNPNVNLYDLQNNFAGELVLHNGGRILNAENGMTNQDYADISTIFMDTFGCNAANETSMIKLTVVGELGYNINDFADWTDNCAIVRDSQGYIRYVGAARTTDGKNYLVVMSFNKDGSLYNSKIQGHSV